MQAVANKAHAATIKMATARAMAIPAALEPGTLVRRLTVAKVNSMGLDLP